MGILLFLLFLGMGAAIGYALAEEQDEELLFLRLIGYAFLGFFTFHINNIVLPLGFLLALWLASRVEVNRRARQTAATVTFVLWLVSLFFPH